MKKQRIDADLILDNIGEAVCVDPSRGEGPLGIVRDAGIVIGEGKIAWVGPKDDLLGLDLDKDTERLDAGGQVVLPGLVDCHTHLVFAGGREGEFEQRCSGASYQEIAAAGGGIVSTMKATREADFDELLDLALHRLAAMLHMGVTTCEVKSGYGLSLEAELKMLEVLRMVGMAQSVSVVPTFLGAHALPPDYRAKRKKYVDLVVEEMLPKVVEEDLAEFCDVFCEQGAFTLEESRRVLTAARDAGLKLRVHAEQLSAFGGAKLAAELGAASADHLEYVDDEALEAMKEAGTVAVLLPGAAFFLGQDFPDARRIRDAGVPIALATDFNPGSSPTMNLPLIGTMAAVRMGLTPAEVIQGMTLEAARALDRADSIGSITPGKVADLALFDVKDYRTLLYLFGSNFCTMVIKEGEVAWP